jgi:hypothetical protein
MQCITVFRTLANAGHGPALTGSDEAAIALRFHGIAGNWPDRGFVHVSTRTNPMAHKIRMLGSAAVLLAACLLSGCVERRFIITSNPPGATVYREGMQLGVTPVDDPFVYYGDKQYTLVLDGFETLKVNQPAPVPWYQIPPLDFASENLWPFKIRDIRRPEPYQLQPLQSPNPNQVVDRAQQLRNSGRAIGEPPTLPLAP